MSDFLTWQLDYIYFFYGLAFTMLAAVSYVMMRKKSRDLPWVWLGLFGIFHGVHEWLEVLSLGLGQSLTLGAVRVTLLALSFVFLTEFGRSGVKGIRGKSPGRWIFVPLVSAASLGFFYGLDGFDAATRYTLGLAGGFWASRAFYLAAGGLDRGRRPWLLAASVAMGLYAVLTAAGSPAASFFPATVVNRTFFQQTFGFPIQLLRGVFTAAVACSLWAYSQAPQTESPKFTYSSRDFFRPVAVIVSVIVAGWFLTDFAGKVAREQTIKDGNLYLSSLAVHFLSTLEGAEHEAMEKAASPDLAAALLSGRPADIKRAVMIISDCKNRQNLDSDLPFCYLMDRKGRTAISCNNKGETVSRNESPFIRKLFKDGGSNLRNHISGIKGYYVADSEFLERSYYAIAPVRDEHRGVVGFVVYREPLDEFEAAIKKHPFCFLADPHGLVFLSSRSDMVLKGLWPLDEGTHRELANSGQFGGGPFRPVMSQEVLDGQYADIGGERVLVSRRSLGRDKWSLVLLTPINRIRTYRLFAIFATFIFCSVILGFFSVLHFTRESAAQIATSERRYRSLVEGSPNCVILFDGQGRCLTINKPGLDLIGCREEEIIGKRLDRLQTEETSRGMDEIIREVLKGRRHSFEAESVRADGRGVSWNAVLNPISDPDGQVRSFVGIFMDITERKAAEDELLRYHEQLEEMVKERTAELSEVNKRLGQEIVERRVAEEELKKHREHLSELVTEQTADLVIANEFLQLEITERKRAEEEIKNFSQKIETIINSSNDLIFMKDRDLRFLVVNEQCAKYFHAPAKEIVGKTDPDLMSAEAAEGCRRSDEAALAAEGPIDVEEYVGDRWMHVVKQKVLDADGNVSGIVAVIRDITDRKKADDELRKYYEQLEERVRERTLELSRANERLNSVNEALRDSEERFRSLFNLASDCIFLIDPADKKGPVIVDANIAACTMNGYSHEELIGRPIAFLDDPESMEKVPDITKMIMGGKSVTFEVNHVRKDGSIFPVEVSAQLIYLSGRPYILAIDRDITIRRETERLIRESQEKYRNLVELTTDIIYMSDSNGNQIFMNDAAFEILGYSRDEVIGRPFISLIHPDDREKTFEKRMEMLEKGIDVFNFENRYVTKGGGEITVLHNVKVVRNENGEVIGTQGIARDITKRKEMEENLALFSKAIEETMDGVQITDLDGYIVYSNNAIKEIYGYPEDELRGKHVNEMNVDPTIAGKLIIPSLKAEGRWTGELLVRHKSGRAFPIWLTASVIKDAEGNALAMVGIVRDMTERKKMEAMLREVSHRQEAILNNIPDLAWLKDKGSRFIAVNEPFAQACGARPEELVGKTDMDIWPSELASRYLTDDEEVMNSGNRKCIEEPLVDIEGNKQWIETVKSPIYNDKGEIIGTAGIARDITERKRAEEELKRHREHLVDMVEERTVELKTAVQLLTNEINFRKVTEETLKESEAKFRKLSREFHTLLDAMPDTLILLSPDLKVMWANKSASAGIGREAGCLTGQHCYKLWYDRSAPCDDCYALRSYESGNAEYSQMTTPSGKLLEARAYPIRDEEGRVSNVIVVLTDITEKSALQAEAMRASHLASLGELAAGVAHEINNPINGIINYAQILANKIDSRSKENDVARRIIKEGDRIAGIVRSLLSFARERKEEKVPATIDRIMHDTITLTETQIRKDGIKMRVEIPDGLPEIVANPQQIQQVFLNLISNARYALNQKYPGTHKEKEFVISGEKIAIEDVPYVRVIFYDRGTGIAPDIIDKILNPFFSTKPGGHGTGLGLSISHGIIRNHGGRLAIDSVEGSYARVVIDLPAKRRDGN